MLALPVTNERGVAVVQRGVQLTKSVVLRLREMGVQRIFVEEPGFMGIECREGLEAAQHSRLMGMMTRLAGAARKSDAPDLSPFAKEIFLWSNAICDALERGPASFLLYPNEGDAVRRWAAHAVNVALLGARTYLNIGGRNQARHMAAAALLMDLDLARLSDEALLDLYTSGGSVTPRFKAHVERSLECARTIPGLPSWVKTVVAQHHERCDGSGYPKGLQGDDIHPLAKVMAVVDSYVYEVQREFAPLLPHDAMEWLMAGVGFEFDHAAVMAFRNAVHLYPVGTEVELDSGERGVVTGVKGPLPSRPCVRVLWDSKGQEVRPYYEINLAEETTKAIKRIV